MKSPVRIDPSFRVQTLPFRIFSEMLIRSYHAPTWQQCMDHVLNEVEPEDRGYCATWAMGMGYIQLAEELRATGIVPSPIPFAKVSPYFVERVSTYWSDVLADHASQPPEFLDAVQVLAFITPQKPILSSDEITNKCIEQSCFLDVVAHLSKRASSWPADWSSPVLGVTPLVMCVAVAANEEQERRFIRNPDPWINEKALDAILALSPQSMGDEKCNVLQAALPFKFASTTKNKLVWRKKTWNKITSWNIDLDRFGPAAYTLAIQWGGEDHLPGVYARKTPPGPKTDALLKINAAWVSKDNPALPMYANPLYMAVALGCTAAIPHLLKAGARVDWVDKDSKENLLMVACGYEKSIRLLSAFPVGSFSSVINQVSAKGDTALHRAVASLSPALVRRCLDEGANPLAKNKSGQSPVDAIRRHGGKALRNLEGVLALLESKSPAISTPQQSPDLLFRAVQSLSVSLVKKLLSQGHDPNQRNKAGRSILEKLVLIRDASDTKRQALRSKQQAQIVSLLHKAGADMNVIFKGDGNALHWAVGHMNAPLVKALLDAGADPYVADKEGRLCIHAFDVPYMWMAADDFKISFEGWLFHQPEHSSKIADVMKCLAGKIDFDQTSAKGEIGFSMVRNLPNNPEIHSIFQKAALQKELGVNRTTNTHHIRKM